MDTHTWSQQKLRKRERRLVVVILVAALATEVAWRMSSHPAPRCFLGHLAPQPSRIRAQLTSLVNTALPMRPSQSSVKVPSMGAGEAKVWVVVTTVNPPTPSVEALVALTVSDKGSFGLVVVGDTKSVARDAYLAAIPTCVPENDCYYLDMKAQEELGLSMYEHIPTRHYARKNIGYAFAVGKGATMVYDTDDDNLVTVPLDETVAKWEKAQAEGLMGVRVAEGVESSVVNPYAHFGRADIWPRGMPLSDIAGDAEQETEYTRGCSARPMVLQGLANGDPDVDAIWRLTRSERGKPIRVTFDSSQPSVLVEPHTFAPFNSQNTLFVKDALWALYIPTTTTFRVCDIWRGYWAQRLLWEIGGSLVFGPPTVFQDRNVHDYLLDFIDEKPMYNATQKLITFLDEWRCDSQYDLFECAVQLASGMAEHAFWGAKDALGVAAWLGDLKALGYTPPARVPLPTPGKRAELTYVGPDASASAPVAMAARKRNRNPGKPHGITFYTQVSGLNEKGEMKYDCFNKHRLDLNLMTYKVPTADGFFMPNSTWTRGRNEMLKAVKRREQARGAPFRYVCLLDGDIEFGDCNKVPAFIDFLQTHTTGSVSPLFGNYGKMCLATSALQNITREERARLVALPVSAPGDAAFQCFAPHMRRHVLPYSDDLDYRSWHNSQHFVAYDTLLSNFGAVDVVQYMDLAVGGGLHADYPRGAHGRDIFKIINATRGGDLSTNCWDSVWTWDNRIKLEDRNSRSCCLSQKSGKPITCPAERSKIVVQEAYDKYFRPP